MVIPFLKVYIYIYIISAGSAASNLGYANITPNSNVNGNFINKDNSHYPGGFGSNQVPGLPGLAGAKYNVDAAAARVPGICMSGGGKKLKRKIKNITKRYKMPKKSMKRNASGMRRKIRSSLSRAMSRSKSMSRSRGRYISMAGGRKKRKTRRQRGGYSQYQNNLPMTPTYSTGGILSAGNLGLANPVPYQVLSNCTNCVDNFNAYEMKGFPSRGH